MKQKELQLSPPGRIRGPVGQSLTFRQAMLTIDGNKACLEIFPGTERDHIPSRRILMTKDQALKLAELIYVLTGTTAAVFDKAIATAAKAMAVRTVKAYLKQHHPETTSIEASDLDQQEITADDLVIDDAEIARIINSLPT